MEHHLLGGEMIIKPDGLYTRVHWYTHPKNGRKVIIAGISHDGTREYYTRIRKILGLMDFVLYEGPPSRLRRASKKQKRLRDLKTITLNKPEKKMSSFDDYFFVLLGLYHKMACAYFQLKPQGIFFNHAKSNWVCGDAEWYKEPAEKNTARRKRSLARLPWKIKMGILKLIERDLARIMKKTYTPRDFGRAMVSIWSNADIEKVFQSLLGTFRDKMCLRRFDEVVQTKNPQCVGIMFGMAHIAKQRKFLERRGYRHVRSQMFRSMKF